ncbi:MAG: uracil-DNA glycosylase family protein [Hydrogenophaga sp.]|uniref:uracil-DNA glycosylase family protein n=1 Tax=Hydrogenophaga sp. TaxID=1904254 RepID=UPI002636B3F4|nr:uracil-DNA glycosylase family protein [Hydrogenophaga sp.]MCV0440246.1 uracil-DNA glycosylase family protein [Hydrogenophaga sp.]
MASVAAILKDVRTCTLCAGHLPLGPRPVLQFHPAARILIAGQAPGRKVHASGVPFDDASGARLRDWLGLSQEVFYDLRRIAILPMGFCYPGTGRSGDLPPRPECAQTWRPILVPQLRQLRLTVAVGRYAMAHHLPEESGSIAEALLRWRDHGTDPRLMPLPHPSPRNNLWLARHPWFERELIPLLRQRVAEALSEGDQPSSN